MIWGEGAIAVFVSVAGAGWRARVCEARIDACVIKRCLDLLRLEGSAGRGELSTPDEITEQPNHAHEGNKKEFCHSRFRRDTKSTLALPTPPKVLELHVLVKCHRQ